jgi:glycerol-3-phosphate acyltransferase PlsY
VPGTGDLTLPAACGLMSVILMLTHWQNIMRLWKNTEPKIGQEKPKAG